jgi:hypothetical protein
LERLVAPDLTAPGVKPPPDVPLVVCFGKTIAAKARAGRPSNKVFCFNVDDVARLDDILAFYTADALEPTFYLTPVSFHENVAAALAAAGFYQFQFQQAITYGVPSRELTGTPRDITIERLSAQNLDDYVTTMADGFEWAPEWREVAIEGTRKSFLPNEQHCFLARYRGEPAAVGTLRVKDGVASLGGGATSPRFRRHGCHSALLRHRLDVAYLLGCSLVTSGADFGSGSFRNQLRVGLHLAYVESGWRRRPQ